jgi:hypothetical protein
MMDFMVGNDNRHSPHFGGLVAFVCSAFDAHDNIYCNDALGKVRVVGTGIA